MDFVEDRPAERGYRFEVWRGRVGTTNFEVVMGGGCCQPLEPFEVFATMRPNGFQVQVCATCSHFRLSGFMRDCSGGTRGYCIEGDRPAEGRPTVAVDYYCGYYNSVDKDDTRSLTSEE